MVPIVVGWSTPALYLGTYPSMWVGTIPLLLWARKGSPYAQLRHLPDLPSSKLPGKSGDSSLDPRAATDGR